NSVGDRPGGFVHTGPAADHARRARILRFQRQEPDRRLGLRLDLRLALWVAAPRAGHEPAPVGDQRTEFVEARGPVGVRLAERGRVVEQGLLRGVQQALDRAVGAVQAELLLLAGVAPLDRDLVRLQVAEPEVEPQRDPPQLAVGELVPRPQVVTVVYLDADRRATPRPAGDRAAQLVDGALDRAHLLVGLAGDRHDHHLYGRDRRGKAQAAVVAVGHDQPADEAGRHAPRRRIRVVLLAVTPEELHVVRVREVLPEEVRGPRLQGLPVAHQRLDREGLDGAGEPLARG